MSCPLPLPLVSRPPLHRWKVLAAGVAANAAFSVAFSGLPMTAVLLRQAYQLDNAQLGLMLGLMGLGIALSELPWGLLTDRLGDRPVLLAGLGGTALALLALAGWAAPGAPLWALGAGLLGVGLLGGSVNGASGRAVMGWFPASERGLAMSIRQTAVPLGGGVGALLLPWLAWQGGFACLFGVLAGLCGAAALLCAAWVHEPAHDAPAPGAGPLAPAPRALRDRRVWRLASGIGLLCAPQFAVISFGTVFLHDFGGLSLPACTGAMALVQVGAMGLRVWSGRWTDRHGNRPAYLRACVAAVIAVFLGLAALSALQQASPGGGWGLLTRTPQALPLLLAACLVLAGLVVSAWHGVAYAELATLAGARQSGTALGLANTWVFVVCFVTPSVLPGLLQWQGWPAVWLAASACAALAGPLLLGPGASVSNRSRKSSGTPL
ncbi:MFS transporter [Curvibacter gracilis]|uniref:MFS transporter n=1 Tax=Curvibacter gracilis TaxID=230310 RepID=UPI0006856A54|nr:MFS transporter [Curvibacter gracilis]